MRGFRLSLPRAAFSRLFEHHWTLRLARRMLGSPGAQQGEVLAERRASGSGRKRQREGDSAAHTEVGAGGAEGEEEEAEEVGGVGRSPAPVARRAAVCSLPATRGALIRRPEPTGQPLPPRRPRHAGPEPAPPAPARAARAGGRPQAGAGSETSRGLVRPGLDPPPAVPLRPREMGEGWRRSGGAEGRDWRDGRRGNYRKREGPRAGPGL